MSQRNARPIPFRPRGLSDSIDSTGSDGAMASLQNLIPDPSTNRLWQCRPASQLLYDFNIGGGPFSPGFGSGFQHGTGSYARVSCLDVFGSVLYGLIASNTNPGKDEPFAFNLVTKTRITVTGVTAANTPTSPATTGAWTPPTMALIGTKLIVTHPGFTGAGGVFFGWFDVTNPAAPTWSGGNVAGPAPFPFTTPPSFVANFNGRAYYIVNPLNGQPFLAFSDVLVPLTITNANQALFFDDNTPLTALAPLPLLNQLGGIIQSLIVFKGNVNVYQVTGDATGVPGNLYKNSLNIATGTLCPQSLAMTTKGLAFIAPDGMRLVDLNARVSEPIGVDGQGKVLPFINVVTPSRVYGVANGSVYRVTVQDGSLVGAPNVEYWFDTSRGVWSGPHTFPAACAVAWQNTFITAPIAHPGALFQSDYVQSAISTFIEDGTQMSFTWATSMLPDTDEMCENAMIETTITMAMASNTNYGVTAINQSNGEISSAIIANTAQPTVWGQFNWGQANWGGSAGGLYPQRVNWPVPVVFRRMQIALQGFSALAVRVGTLHLRYEKLGYLQQDLAA